MKSSGPSQNRIIIYQLLPRLFSNTQTTSKLFGTIEENGCGKLNGITETALAALKKLGATHIWFTGVLEHATCTDYSGYGIAPDNPRVVKGRAGSPYAIKDYYDIDPDLAEDVPLRMQEFEALVQRCHKQGLKVIIDFVPNHVARHYVSDAKPLQKPDLGEQDNKEIAFSPSNDFYYLPGTQLQLPLETEQLEYVKGQQVLPFHEEPAKATGNGRFSANPDIHDWYETVKLNYGVDYMNQGQKHFEPMPNSWKKMLDILLFWCQKGVDGFRCDMAEMVPVEFWHWAINEVKQSFPEIIFIAEIYNPVAYRNFLEQGKFDFLYDKVGLYDTLRNVMSGHLHARQITKVWQDLDGMDGHMLRFMENHDEQRIASDQLAGSALAGLPAMGVSGLMNTGPVMLYCGQETGEQAATETGFSTNDGRTSIFDYCSMPEFVRWVNNGAFDGALMNEQQRWLRNFYSRLLNLAANEIFAKGAFYDLMWHNNDSSHFDGKSVYTFMRYLSNEAFLVIANFNGKEPCRLQIKFPSDLLDLMGLKVDQHFSVYGQDKLWEKKEFFADGKEFRDQGLNIILPAGAVYAFKLDFQTG